ncbi:hypothetical protein RhiirA5_425235 [Rhizophagus irregularis]|uniref:Peptidase M12A domain-containing protein n=1 Tax=Rhizophagus irregularis TaxID=588596 RepID=A0A2N0P6G1_9GLOM|nr:hypothetical protein RhiirA5_425235 [Rhizophagus irregularis]
MNKPVAERNSFDNNVALGIQNIVSNAMNMISDVSSVKFVKRTDQSDYVKIVDKGVRVDIGIVDNQGLAKLSTSRGQYCIRTDACFGLYHEHRHPYRDKYLTVIVKEKIRDFGKLKEDLEKEVEEGIGERK